MKYLRTLILGSFLLAGTSYADGFGFNLGPFNLHLFSDDDGYFVSHRSTVNDPICYAISHQKRLEIIVEGRENVSTKEKKIVTKKLIIEPYAFGVTNEGKPVLRGNIVEEKLVKEVSVKYGNEKFDETSVSKEKGGYFSGLYKSDKNNDIDIRRVSDVRVIEDSHFDAPKDYKGLREENVRVTCQLPISA